MVAESHETSSFGGDPICDTKKPICLCLSGGGFRATFFHLGVIIALRQLKLMSAIGHIVSVSGGSILAGHLACYWKDYQDDNDYSFLKRVTEILKFGRCDLRGKILRRMIFGMFLPGLRRRQQLLKYYSRLYGNRVLVSYEFFCMQNGDKNFTFGRGLHTAWG